MCPNGAGITFEIGARCSRIEAVDAIFFIVEEETEVRFDDAVDIWGIAIPIMIGAAAGEVVIGVGAIRRIIRTFCLNGFEDGFSVFIERIVDHAVASGATPTLEVWETVISSNTAFTFRVIGDHLVYEVVRHITVAGTSMIIMNEVVVIDGDFDIGRGRIGKIGTLPSRFYFAVGGTTVIGDGISVVTFFADGFWQHPHGDAVTADGFAITVF